MLTCAREEPLQPNRYLWALNEVSAQLEPSVINEPRLYRYTFVGTESCATALMDFAHMLELLRQQFFSSMTWCLVRPYDLSEQHRIPTLTWLARRKKGGWDVYHDNTLAIARKQVHHIEPSFQPPGYVADQYDNQSVLFLGETPSIEHIAHSPARPTLGVFAQRAPLAPSKEFLLWMVEHNGTIAYRIQDHLGLSWGLVLISPIRIPVQSLQEQGMIQRLTSGADPHLMPFM